MENQEKIKDKIAKLIRKANSSRELGSIEEAASFMMMANKLLMKYNLERTDIELEDTSNRLSHDVLNLNDEHQWNKSSGDWMMHIYNMTASMNLCFIISDIKKEYKRTANGDLITKNGEKIIITYVKLTLIGNEMNKEVTRYMATSMINQLKSLSRDAWSEYQQHGGNDKVNAWRRAYFRGAVNTLYKIFKDHKENQFKELGESLSALVLTNQVELKDYISNNLGVVKTAQSGRLKSADGAAQGKRDGHKVKVNSALMGSAMSKGRLLN